MMQESRAGDLHDKNPRESVRTHLELAHCRFHAMLDSLSASDWSARSRNPAWTNGQLVYHILFAFMLVPSLFWMIKFWSRLPARCSRGFAQVLNFTTPVFNRINAIGPRGQAFVFGRKRAGAIFDWIHRSILKKVDSLHGDQWAAGMHYPRRWDPTFGDFMTFEDLFKYPPAHFEHHLSQLSAGSVAGCSSDSDAHDIKVNPSIWFKTISGGQLMKKIFIAMIVVLLSVAASFGQAELEKYVGQYQVTGAPLMITVTAAGGKLAIAATGQGKADIELVAGENYAVTGSPIKLTFQKDATGKVTGMIIHQAPGLDVPAVKINSSTEAPSDRSPHKSAFVTANGIKMNYLDWGGTGDVIIMLAGLGNDAHVFDEIAPSFTDKFRVIGLTRRGWGETDRPAQGYETMTRVEDIRAFMDAQKIPRAHLVGHSLAGDEMTLFASMYPQRVVKMVYLDAAYDRRKIFSCTSDQPGGMPASYLRIVGEAMNCPGWEKIVARDMPPPELVNVQVSTMRAAMQFVPDYKKIKAPSLAIYADADLPQNAGKLDEETTKKLAIWWKEHQTPKARASIAQFRKEMKNGQVVEIKGATHYVFVGQHKDQVIKLTKEFLAK